MCALGDSFRCCSWTQSALGAIPTPPRRRNCAPFDPGVQRRPSRPRLGRKWCFTVEVVEGYRREFASCSPRASTPGTSRWSRAGDPSSGAFVLALSTREPGSRCECIRSGGWAFCLQCFTMRDSEKRPAQPWPHGHQCGGPRRAGVPACLTAEKFVSCPHGGPPLLRGAVRSTLPRAVPAYCLCC